MKYVGLKFLPILILSVLLIIFFKNDSSFNIIFYLACLLFSSVLAIFYYKNVSLDKPEYDSKLFSYLSDDDVEGFKKYTNLKYKSVKELEKVFYYVIL